MRVELKIQLSFWSCCETLISGSVSLFSWEDELSDEDDRGLHTLRNVQLVLDSQRKNNIAIFCVWLFENVELNPIQEAGFDWWIIYRMCLKLLHLSLWMIVSKWSRATVLLCPYCFALPSKHALPLTWEDKCAAYDPQQWATWWSMVNFNLVVNVQFQTRGVSPRFRKLKNPDTKFDPSGSESADCNKY